MVQDGVTYQKARFLLPVVHLGLLDELAESDVKVAVVSGNIAHDTDEGEVVRTYVALWTAENFLEPWLENLTDAGGMQDFELLFRFTNDMAETVSPVLINQMHIDQLGEDPISARFDLVYNDAADVRLPLFREDPNWDDNLRIIAIID